METYIIISILVIAVLFLCNGVFFIFKYNQLKGQVNVFTGKNFFRLYLYLMSFFTLLVFSIGVSQLLKAGFSYAFGPEFSYNVYLAPEEHRDPPVPGSRPEEFMEYDRMMEEDSKECFNGEEVLVLDGKNYCFDSSTRKSDILYGISLSLTMLVLFILHRGGLLLLRDDQQEKIFQKMYDFSSLVLYSIVGLIFIPIAIYSLVEYLVMQNEGQYDSYGQSPGGNIAVALVVVPLWLIFLMKAYLELRRK